jgi:YHS domain-containing protein
MTRSLFIFLGTFAAGALIALVTRAALHDPHADHKGHVTAGGDYAPMVANVLAPASDGKARAATAAVEHSNQSRHAEHAAPASASADPGKPVNTVCAICGMDVDPRMPTAEYQGKTIGFGCRMCPPKFKADPDRYGPLYLKNEVVKR